MRGKKFRVLVAENAPGEAADALRAVFPEPDSKLQLSTVSTVATLLATIERGLPEAIFLDLAVGRPDPLDAVRRVRRAAPGTPLIVCADVADKGFASRSLSEGAIDYVLKGFMDSRTVERVLRTALERNTLEGLADLLRDEISGLYNREGFMALGTRAMESAVRSGGTLVLLCLTLDNLSAVQQELGSAGSDRAIREVTEVVQTCFRRSDLVARLGKTEFAALAVDAAEPSAPILRQRVESRLAVLNLSREEGVRLESRLSVGYWGANDPRSFTELLEGVETELRQTPVPLGHGVGPQLGAQAAIHP
jgi:diguanylate cyclase (GGDEF)-like protein